MLTARFYLSLFILLFLLTLLIPFSNPRTSFAASFTVSTPGSSYDFGSCTLSSCGKKAVVVMANNSTGQTLYEIAFWMAGDTSHFSYLSPDGSGETSSQKNTTLSYPVSQGFNTLVYFKPTTTGNLQATFYFDGKNCKSENGQLFDCNYLGGTGVTLTGRVDPDPTATPTKTPTPLPSPTPTKTPVPATPALTASLAPTSSPTPTKSFSQVTPTSTLGPTPTLTSSNTRNDSTVTGIQSSPTPTSSPTPITPTPTIALTKRVVEERTTLLKSIDLPATLVAKGSETTNLKRVKDPTNAAVVFDIPGKNKVEFLENINLLDSSLLHSLKNLDDVVVLGKTGVVFVDSQSVKALSKSARVTMRKLPYLRAPMILRDGKLVQVSEVTDVQYDTSERSLSFKVRGFSTYQTVAGAETNLPTTVSESEFEVVGSIADSEAEVTLVLGGKSYDLALDAGGNFREKVKFTSGENRVFLNIKDSLGGNLQIERVVNFPQITSGGRRSFAPYLLSFNLSLLSISLILLFWKRVSRSV